MQKFAADEQFHHAAFGVAWRGFHINCAAHGDGLLLTRIDNRHIEFNSYHQGRRNARNFCRENAVYFDAFKTLGKFLAHARHKLRVKLVIEQTINLEDAVSEITAFAENTLPECFHVISYLSLG